MNIISKKTVLFSGIMAFLVFSIPNVHAITFDEQTCMSLLTVEQVKSVTGFEKSINVRTVNGDLTELNDHLKSGCAISFEHEDNLQFTLALLASSNISEEDNREKYSQLVLQTESMEWPIEFFKENGWEYNVVEIKEMGLGNSLLSIKGDITIGFNAPPEDTPIETSALVELIKIVHANVDKKSESTDKDESQLHVASLKQIANGISPQDVTCKDGMMLVFKNSDDSSACVKPNTAVKLVERDWAR